MLDGRRKFGLGFTFRRFGQVQTKAGLQVEPQHQPGSGQNSLLNDIFFHSCLDSQYDEFSLGLGKFNLTHVREKTL